MIELDDSPAAANVALVERLWDALQRGGVDALVALTDESVVWRPFAAGGRTLRGHRDLRAHFARLQREGVSHRAHPYAFEALGASCVLVAGALRVQTQQGLEDRQLFWLYRVRDGRL